MTAIPKKTILVCDDEPHIVQVVATKLRNAGFEVVTAEDGHEAFERASAVLPALVISDYQMPVMSGLELAKKLRKQNSTAEIPIVLVTARGYSLTADQLGNTNIRTVALKPFSPREILSTVQRLLNVETSPAKQVVEVRAH